MKTCPKCNQPLDDNAAFCTNCGAAITAVEVDPYDHTAEFDKKDISDNKVISMLVYLLGPIGIIIALLASATSSYSAYHVRQALKFTVVEILSTIAGVLLFGFSWMFSFEYDLLMFSIISTCIVYGGFILFLTVLKFICFFQICAGKAKEPILIRNLKFLK